MKGVLGYIQCHQFEWAVAMYGRYALSLILGVAVSYPTTEAKFDRQRFPTQKSMAFITTNAH